MENYIQSMCAEAISRKWRVACIIARGNAGLKLLTWKPYNGAFTYDFKNVLAALKERYPNAPLMAAGYSLGANVVAKYCGEVKDSLLTGACSVSNPLDFYKSTFSMQSSFIGRHIFSSIMLYGLKRMINKNRDMLMKAPHADKIDFDLVNKIQDIYVFDDNVTCKLFEFPNAKAYYDSCSSLPYLRHITTPFLLISADDDEVSNTIPKDKLPEICTESSYVSAVLTRNGGHVGWLEVRNPLNPLSYFTFQNSWSDRAVGDFLEECLKKGKNSK